MKNGKIEKEIKKDVVLEGDFTKRWDAEFIEGREKEVLSMTREQRVDEMIKNLQKYKEKYGHYPKELFENITITNK